MALCHSGEETCAATVHCTALTFVKQSGQTGDSQSMLQPKCSFILFQTVSLFEIILFFWNLKFYFIDFIDKIFCNMMALASLRRFSPAIPCGDSAIVCVDSLRQFVSWSCAAAFWPKLARPQGGQRHFTSSSSKQNMVVVEHRIEERGMYCRNLFEFWF